MSLRVKLLLVAGGTMAILMLILIVSARFIITNSYTRFEQQDTRTHVELALNALTNDLANLQRTAVDYGTWDDTCVFMQDRTPGYLERNYTDSTFINNRLSLVMLVDKQGQPVYIQAFDLAQNQAAPLAAQTQAAILQDAALLQPPQEPRPRFGLIMLPDGPFLIASQSILNSVGDGPTRGALIMARALATSEIEQLSEVTQLQLTAIDLRGTLEPEAQAARAALSDQQPIVVRAVNELLVQGYALITDIHGQPVLLRVDRDRNIYQQGQQILSYLVLALIVVGLIVGILLVIGLERTVITRLHRLDREVRDIGASTDLTQRVSAQGRDEIGSLTTGINHTFDSLETAQRRLRQREREALTLLDSMPAYAFFKDAQGCYVTANQEFCATLHRTREAISGKTDYDFYPPDRAERYRADDAYVMEHGETREFAEETIGSGPDAIVLATKKVPLKDERSQVIGLIGLAFDVTERRRAAQELALARDQALEALRFKSQLLTHVSHDLRTPINAILGYTEMLQAEVFGPLSEQQTEPLMRISLSCNQLARLINNLLGQSRGEAGQLALVTRPFTLADLIDTIKIVADPIAQDKHLEFRCHIDPAAPAKVQGDFNRLYQVVLNLVDNALKFTEQGTIDLRITRPDAAHYAIVVADTGRGIPAAEQALVFEAFEQGDAPARGRYKGIGLGLSIVKQLTTLMGGQISLSSQIGQGSTFTITLPISADHRLHSVAAPMPPDTRGLRTELVLV
jgi:PAS domain S-box-containing protein